MARLGHGGIPEPMGNELQSIDSDRLKPIISSGLNPVAVVFELLIHFGPDQAAADRFIAQIKQRYRSPIGSHMTIQNFRNRFALA
jgi:hypothetical protein